MEHVGGKQCDPPRAALACGLHHRNGNIHRSCHDSLTYFLCLEETAVTQELVEIHLFLLKKNIHADLQCAKRREQMRTHEVRKGEAALGCTDKHRTSLFKVRDVFARNIIEGKQSTAICIAHERFL